MSQTTIQNNFMSTEQDIQQQDAINNALISAGLPQNKLNGLISMAQDHLLCDSACQKERTSNKLKKIWDNAKINLRTAPEQVENAEKNYYIYDKGYAKYQDLLFDRYSKSAEEMKQSSIIKHDELVSKLKTLMKTYDAETIYSKRMNELLRLRKNENKQLKDDINNYIGTVQTNERKVDYENIDSSWISTIRTVLIYIYYFLFVLYFIISDYFITEKYKSIKVWIYIVCYLIFPYFLNWIVVQLYYIKNYIYHKFTMRSYKNAYKNI
jgi:hypothetical protein